MHQKVGLDTSTSLHNKGILQKTIQVQYYNIIFLFFQLFDERNESGDELRKIGDENF